MTRAELRLLSDAFAVAHAAMVAPETRVLPMQAALALEEAARRELPGFQPQCRLFVDALHASHGVPSAVQLAGRKLRDAVAAAMVFVPHDWARADIHG